MTKLSRVLTFALSQRWALEEGFHGRMLQVLSRQHDGGDGLVRELVDTVRAQTAPRAPAADKREREAEDLIDVADLLGGKPALQVDKGVATIPIHGVISHRASMFEDVCPGMGTSCETIGAHLQEAMTREDVHAIVLDVDSPGGSVSGVDALASEIRAARDRKPILAHTDAMMASAAYYLASQATHVYATRDADVGAIGVIASLIDNHRNLQDRGYDPVVVKSTPGKGHMQSNGAFGDAQRADLQREVDHFHEMFVDAVAAGRRIDRAKAAALGDGRAYIGREALDRGLVDGLQTFANTLRQARTLARTGARAAANDAAPVAEDPSPPEADVADGITATENDPMSKQQTNEPAPAPATAAATSTAPTQTQADGIRAERERQAAIRSACKHNSVLAAKLCDEGTPLPEAMAAINADLSAQLEAARTLPAARQDPLARGNTAQVAGNADPARDAAAAIDAMEDGEEKWAAQWKADKKLRAEFEALARQCTHMVVRDATTGAARAPTALELYQASMRNEAKARVVGTRSALDRDLEGAEALDAAPAR